MPTPPKDAFARLESPIGQDINRELFYRYGNLPVRLNSASRLPMIPHDAAPHEDLQVVRHPHTEVFRLWVPEEKERYDKVLERWSTGSLYLRYEERQFVQEHLSWVILLSWISVVLEEPRNAPVVDRDGRPVNGYQTDSF